MRLWAVACVCVEPSSLHHHAVTTDSLTGWEVRVRFTWGKRGYEVKGDRRGRELLEC